MGLHSFLNGVMMVSLILMMQVLRADVMIPLYACALMSMPWVHVDCYRNMESESFESLASLMVEGSRSG